MSLVVAVKIENSNGQTEDMNVPRSEVIMNYTAEELKTKHKLHLQHITQIDITHNRTSELNF